MEKEIAIKLSQLPIINTINDLQNIVESKKPIAEAITNKVFQKLKLDWNYNSNAIEGNKLNYGETVAYIMHGLTAKGKTIKDHLDIKGHNEAIHFIVGLIKDERDITETDIRTLHQIILVEEYEIDTITEAGLPTKKTIKIGTYKTSPNSVKTKTGEMHYYATPEETPAKMYDLMNWYKSCNQDKNIHPIVLASLFHFYFVAIHPFDDGNGRLARILMNLILMRNNYLPIVVKNDDKTNYYGVLAQSDTNQYIPLIEYMGNLLVHTLNIQLKAINGESIDEESDIDKEIALLKKSLEKDVLERIEFSKDIEIALENSLLEFDSILEKNVYKLEDLFHQTYIIKDGEMSPEIGIKSITDYFRFLKHQQLNFKISQDIFFNDFGKYIYQYKLNFLTLRSNPNISITKNLSVIIGFNYYQINFNKNSIQKYYNETLTKEEIDTFVNNTMKDILSEIKQNIK